MTLPDRLPYEQSHPILVQLPCCQCRRCGKRWEAHPGEDIAERAARGCCALDRPCQTSGCAGRTTNSYGTCAVCEERRDAEKHATRPTADPGDAWVYAEAADDFYPCVEDALDAHYDPTETPREAFTRLRLVVCKRDQVPSLDVDHILEGWLPEDTSPEDAGIDVAAIEAAWKAATSGAMDVWVPTNTAVAWDDAYGLCEP